MRLTLSLAVVACVVGLCPRAVDAETPNILRPSETIEPRSQLPLERPPVITALAVAPGGENLATAGDDHVVRLWNITSGQLVHRLNGHTDWVRALAYTPDGKTLISAGDDHTITLWDAHTGKQTGQLPPHPQVIYAIACSADGKLLAAAGFEAPVRLYNLETHELVKELAGPGADLRAVVFSPDDTRLAVAGRGGQVRVWNIASGEVDLNIAAERLGRLRALAWLPDGERLVSAGENRLLCVWDAKNGQLLKRLPCQTGKLMSMVVCTDQLIATGGSDNAVRVWDWQREIESDTLLGHTGSVAALAFDPASKTIISGGFDTTVRVWRLKDAASDQGSGDQNSAADLGQKYRIR